MAVTFHPNGKIDGINNANFNSSLPSGHVIQIQKGTYTSTSNTTNSSDDTWQDFGCSANITMSDASNKVLVSFSGSRILASVNYNGLRIVRGSTAIRQFWCYNQNGNWDSDMIGTMHEDTPGAGTHTYKIQQFTDQTTSQHLLNYIGNASNSDGLAQIHIYLMEIKS